MKRLIKLLRNLLLIVVLLVGIAYLNGNRFSAASAARKVGQTLFLEDPLLESIGQRDKYAFFLMEEADVQVCTVVKRSYGVLWNMAEFGNTWTRQPTEDPLLTTQACLLTYDAYFNTRYRDLSSIKAYLQPVTLNFNLGTTVYRIQDNRLRALMGRDIKPYLDMPYQDFLDQGLNKDYAIYYADGTPGYTQSTNLTLTSGSLYITRPDRDGIDYDFGFHYTYLLNHPEDYTVGEVLNLSESIPFYNAIEEKFKSYTTSEALKELDEQDLTDLLTTIITENGFDIRLSEVELYESVAVNKDELSKVVDPVKEYVANHKLEVRQFVSELTLDEFKTKGLKEILDGYGTSSAFIKTKDFRYVHLDKTDQAAIGDPVEIDGNVIQLFIKFYDTESVTTVLKRPNLDALFEPIIRESYTPIRTPEDMAINAMRIKTALAENLGIPMTSLSVSMYITSIPEQAS